MSVIRAVVLLLGLAAPAFAQFVEPPLVDNCNRVEDPLSNSGQWTTDVVSTHPSTLEATGTVCTRAATAGLGSAWWNVVSFTDGAISATFVDATSGTSQSVGFVLRSTNHATATDGYVAFFDGNVEAVTLNRFDDSAVVTLITCSAVTLSDGDKIGFRVVGTSPTTLTAWLDTGGGFTQVCSTTDGTYTGAGYAGVLFTAALYTVDDIRLGSLDVVPSAGALMPILP